MTPCDVCNRELREKEGFLLGTEEVITSEKYWEKALRMLPMRSAEAKVQYVKLMTSQTKPWIICDTCIVLFSVDQKHARQNAVHFYLSGGTFSPRRVGGVYDVHTTDVDLEKLTDLPKITICKGCRRRIMPTDETWLMHSCPYCGHADWIRLVWQIMVCLFSIVVSFAILMHPEIWERTDPLPWWIQALLWVWGTASSILLISLLITAAIGLRSFVKK